MSVSSTTPGFLARLKESTRPLHDEVERSVDMGSSMKTIVGYRALLGRFLGFQEPAEIRLGAMLWPEPVTDFPRRRTSALLRDDLRALGFHDDDIAALPRCVDLPAMSTVPEALGCLYVLEGSTLGGQYIAKHIQSTLDIGRDNGGSFFRSYGEDVGPMWKAFGAILTAEATTEPVQAGIIQGAHEMFHSFMRWFAPFSPAR